MEIFDRISQRMITHEVNLLKQSPSQRDELTAALKATTQRQNSIIQQISDRAAEGRPRLAALDDQLDELEATREKLAADLNALAEPVEDFQEKIAKLKAQFNPTNMEIIIRKLILLARHNADEQAKQRLMPIVAI
ncbi:hypothetical protein N2600_20240 [Rhizobium sp. WSM1274]|jgi:flagellar biosynthesis chaperone FliJ|uniref:hypothetical protein n=1 Tax=Rhizobium sp. WSM1274 TaxID=3138254 RepID=UPI0021A357F4|nr:hypothetical protein [Rhizobium leguminosarum]UWU27664.1 hypothetical protein N2600_20240 [Rhizobium leguminosarum bv. viciae]